jgi:hypothetical protein
MLVLGFVIPLPILVVGPLAFVGCPLGGRIFPFWEETRRRRGLVLRGGGQGDWEWSFDSFLA